MLNASDGQRGNRTYGLGMSTDNTRSAATGETGRASVMRETLLLTAERLFAERGIEAVSLREIASAAGNGNNNAVQYHFGSKEGLVHAIFEFRVLQMDGPRRGMLALAKQDGTADDLQTLMRMILLPHLDLADETGRHPHAALQIEYLTRWRPQGMMHPADEDIAASDTLRFIMSGILAKLDHLPVEIATTRLGLAQLMFANLLVLMDHETGPVRDSRDLRIRDTVHLATSLLLAPLH